MRYGENIAGFLSADHLDKCFLWDLQIEDQIKTDQIMYFLFISPFSMQADTWTVEHDTFISYVL